MGRHYSQDLDEFTRGETAQVIARDTRDGSIVFLPRGGAHKLRAVAKSYFECPIAGCAAPRPLTARGGSKRDHFAHAPGSGINHGGAGESFNHVQAKHSLAQWALQSTRDDGTDAVITEEAWLPSIRRRPDVLVRYPDGQRLAIEVEYKHLTEDDYDAKVADYAAEGIVPSYVFGHTHRHFRRTANGVRLTPIAKHVARSGRPVLFINPFTQTVATLYEIGVDIDHAIRAYDKWQWREAEHALGKMRRPSINPFDEYTVFRVAIDPLRDCWLEPRFGIITPTWQRIRNEHTRAAQERERRMATDYEVVERARWETRAAAREAAARSAGQKRAERASREAERMARERDERRLRLESLLTANRARLAGEPEPTEKPMKAFAANSVKLRRPRFRVRVVTPKEQPRCPVCGLKMDPSLERHLLC